MTMHRFALLVALATASTAGICTKTYNYTNPSPVPAPAPVVDDVVEFRVFGQVGNAPISIRFTNSVDGTTVLTALSLPYIATVKNREASIFLDLEASATPASSAACGCPTSGTFLQAQIFVNGRLFREAFAANLVTLAVIANGTFRRGE
jgi:hypothetical protein